MILFFVYNSSLFYRYNIDYKINSFISVEKWYYIKESKTLAELG